MKRIKSKCLERRPFIRLRGWQTDKLAGWEADWWTNRRADKVTDCQSERRAAWPSDNLASGPADRLKDCQEYGLTNWQSCLADKMTGEESHKLTSRQASSVIGYNFSRLTNRWACQIDKHVSLSLTKWHADKMTEYKSERRAVWQAQPIWQGVRLTDWKAIRRTEADELADWRQSCRGVKITGEQLHKLTRRLV